MHARDFCFWLQGFFEVAEPDDMTCDQVSMVRRHLALVFKHEIDPAMGDAKHQKVLNDIHNPSNPVEAALRPPPRPPRLEGDDFRPRC